MTALILVLLAQAPLEVELTGITNDIIQEHQLSYEVTVDVPEWMRSEYIVNAYSHIHGSHVYITVGPLLAEDLDTEGRRGLMAHELAHTQNLCGPAYLDGLQEQQECEHQADVLAAQWVGSRAVLRGLCQLRASSWYWRYTTDASHLNRRIRLLHNINKGLH